MEAKLDHLSPVPQPWAHSRLNWPFIAVWAPVIAGWVSLLVWICS